MESILCTRGGYEKYYKISFTILNGRDNFKTVLMGGCTRMRIKEMDSTLS
jgi:hypothetical protein